MVSQSILSGQEPPKWIKINTNAHHTAPSCVGFSPSRARDRNSQYPCRWTDDHFSGAMCTVKSGISVVKRESVDRSEEKLGVQQGAVRLLGHENLEPEDVKRRD